MQTLSPGKAVVTEELLKGVELLGGGVNGFH